MKKLTTIVLAVLILCLQVFSCTVAYGSDEDEDNPIEILGCTPNKSQIYKDDVVNIGLVIKNVSNKKLTNIRITIKESSFSGWTSDQGPTIAELEPSKDETVFFDAYYNGYGRDLVLSFKYNIEDIGEKKTNKTIKIPGAVPVQEPSTDTSQYVPRLVADAGEMPVINAGSTYRLKYKIDNKSGH